MGPQNQKRPRLLSLDEFAIDEFKFDIQRDRDLAFSTTRRCRCPPEACVLIIILHSHFRARPPTDFDFKGQLHQARPRRLRGGLKIVGILAACYIGGFAINWFVRIKTGGTIPPHIWARTADQQTRDEVEEALAMAFNTARNSAPQRRNDALREATFEVPHELARLNRDAPGFRLEDLGPMVQGKKIWDRLGELTPIFAPFVDCAEETRVFLYFPSGATKATAVFVAVNSELKHALHKKQPPLGVGTATRGSIEVALLVSVWRTQHRIWAQRNPAVIGRIEDVERLPVIFNFRDEAFGAMYYTRLEMILDPSMCLIPLVTTRLNGGILQE